MGIFTRGSKLWIAFKDVDGRWRNASTGHSVGEEDAARRKLEAVLAAVKAQQPSARAAAPSSVRAYAEPWLDKRKAADLDWKNDRSRLTHHVLPVIGDMPLASVRAKQVAELVHRWRTTKLESTGAPMAQRTVYNVYSVVSALFRDAEIDGLIEKSPCILTDAQLGPLIDSDPEWRSGAVYTSPERDQLHYDERIPFDRRLYYALMLDDGSRPGDIAALRWSHYDPNAPVLGRLTFALAHNTRKGTTRHTKTGAVRHAPVHPVLAAMLAEWKLGGWAKMMGRAPTPDDLLLPLPPADAAARRSREGEPIRTGDYAGKKWREVDQPMLGWRPREMYAMKSTFLTLCAEAGCDRELIKRITHTPTKRDAFDGYVRTTWWEPMCHEILKLKIGRRETVAMAAGAEGSGSGGQKPPYSSVQSAATEQNESGNSGGGGSRTQARTAIPNAERASTLSLVKNEPTGDPIGDALRAVSIALRTDEKRTRREVLRLLADVE